MEKATSDDLCRERRVYPQGVVADFESGVAADDHVDGAGHGSQMDSFPGGAALDVGEVALEGPGEEIPGSFAVASGLHPGVHHVAQRRPVGGACPVKVHRAHNGLGRERVAHVVQQVPEFLGREEVQEHEHVGLF